MPNEPKQSNICEVYRMNPDGSKGEHLRTDPGFPEGWDEKIYNGTFNPKKEEEIEMTRTARTRKPSSEEMEQNWEKCGKTINAFANQYDIGWATARTWLTEAGLLEAKPKKDYFGTLIVGREPDVIQQETPEQEPEFIGYRTEIANAEVMEAIKIKFANITLAADLPDWMKLSMIESIVRM